VLARLAKGGGVLARLAKGGEVLANHLSFPCKRESSKYNIRKNNKFPLSRGKIIKKNNKMNRDGNSCLSAGREPVLNFVVF
jgi:hypothetical protein